MSKFILLYDNCKDKLLENGALAIDGAITLEEAIKKMMEASKEYKYAKVLILDSDGIYEAFYVDLRIFRRF